MADKENKTRKMSVVQLTIITAVNMMGSGIIMLPSNLAAVGSISILSWLVTLTGALCLAYGFARCGMFARNQRNGMGGYCEDSFGKNGNFMANYTYAISLVVANVAIAVSCVSYGSVVFNVTLNPVVTALWVIAVVVVTTVANFWGPKITGRIGSVTVWGVIIPVVFLAIFGWFWFHPETYMVGWNPTNQPLGSAIGASIPLTLWSFLGLESAAANADAVDNPEKNVPIAILVGTTFAGACYILSTTVMEGFIANKALAASNAPFGLAFATIFPAEWHLSTVVEALMTIACIGSLLGWQFTVAEVFRSSANAGYFPAIFKKRNKYQAPVWGMLILMAAQIIIAFGTMNPSINEEFNILVNICVMTDLVPYVLDMAAVKLLQIKAGRWKGDVGAHVSWWVAVVACMYSLYAMYTTGTQAMLWGSLITFFGWLLWGFISKRYSGMELGVKDDDTPVTQITADKDSDEKKDTIPVTTGAASTATVAQVATANVATVISPVMSKTPMSKKS